MDPQQSTGRPTRPQSPSPPPSPEAASSRVSAKASPPEGPGFIADAGPAFDPERVATELPPAPPTPEAEQVPLIQWEQDTVEALLRLKGRAIHAGIGVAEDDWHYTELDLAAIAPPLTRICNRYEPVARLARHADPLLLALALGGYTVRSLEERAEVLRELEALDVSPIEPVDGEVAINGVPAAPPQPPRPAGQYSAPAEPAAVDPEDLDWSTGAQP